MVKKIIPLFERIEIETQSTCNRKCVWCIRNSDPDKVATAPWFKKTQLPVEIIDKIIDESLAIGFKPRNNYDICINHYNEPMMDKRLVDIIKRIKSKANFGIFCGSNADYLTKKLAGELDGLIDEIGFTLYYGGEKFIKRRDHIKTLFNKTKITICDGSNDETYPMLTHYNPIVKDVNEIAKSRQSNICRHPLKRLIINHLGEMLMCCDDLTGNFKLGSIYENTVEELWYGEKHQRLVAALQKPNGRKVPGNEHCLTCPRSG